MPNDPKEIILWGPPSIDWLNTSHEQSGMRPPQSRHKQREVFLSAQPGGVALLEELVAAMCPKDIAVIKLCAPDDDDDYEKLIMARKRSLGEWEETKLDPRDPKYRRTWSLWQKRGEPRKGGEPSAYRMDPAGVTNWERGSFCLDDPLENASQREKLLILDDSGSYKSPGAINQNNKEKVKSYAWLSDELLEAKGASNNYFRAACGLGRVQKQVRRAGGVSPLILHPSENQGADAPRSPGKLFLDAS